MDLKYIEGKPIAQYLAWEIMEYYHDKYNGLRVDPGTEHAIINRQKVMRYQ